MTGSDAASSSAPPRPCTARSATSSQRSSTRPHAREATANTTSPAPTRAAGRARPHHRDQRQRHDRDDQVVGGDHERHARDGRVELAVDLRQAQHHDRRVGERQGDRGGEQHRPGPAPPPRHHRGAHPSSSTRPTGAWHRAAADPAADGSGAVRDATASRGRDPHPRECAARRSATRWSFRGGAPTPAPCGGGRRPKGRPPCGPPDRARWSRAPGPSPRGRPAVPAPDDPVLTSVRGARRVGGLVLRPPAPAPRWSDSRATPTPRSGGRTALHRGIHRHYPPAATAPVRARLDRPRGCVLPGRSRRIPARAGRVSQCPTSIPAPRAPAHCEPSDGSPALPGP